MLAARVVVLPFGEVPVAAFHVHVQVGFADEWPGQEGLAHCAEHMAFQGSRRIQQRITVGAADAGFPSPGRPSTAGFGRDSRQPSWVHRPRFVGRFRRSAPRSSSGAGRRLQLASLRSWCCMNRLAADLATAEAEAGGWHHLFEDYAAPLQ